MSTNEPMTREQLDAIQERVDAATDGPWVEGTRCVFTEDYARAIVSDSLVEVPGMTPYAEAVQNPADVALIAHAPEDLAALLAEVERLRALTTVTEDMVERGKAAHHEAFNAWKAKRSLEDADNRKSAAMRAALNAALGTGEEA